MKKKVFREKYGSITREETIENKVNAKAKKQNKKPNLRKRRKKYDISINFKFNSHSSGNVSIYDWVKKWSESTEQTRNKCYTKPNKSI